MKIALCTLAIGDEYKKVVSYGTIGKQAYCKLHEYDFRDDEDIYDKSRPIAWSKIQLILKCLEHKLQGENSPIYDYVVWMDADTHIMDFEHRLEDFIERLMDSRDFMVAQDFKEINTGVIFVKNTEWSKMFLTYIYSLTDFINYSHWEQDAIIHVYENMLVDSHSHVKRLYCIQSREFNPYYQVYRPGDFLIHLCGCYIGNGENGLKHMMDMFCPLRMHDDSDESYNHRKEFLKNWCG
jgi:galactosyl transferase GMA12/MNN10 family